MSEFPHSTVPKFGCFIATQHFSTIQKFVLPHITFPLI